MIKSVIQTTTHDATICLEPVIWPSIAEASKTQVNSTAADRANFENSIERKSNMV